MAPSCTAQEKNAPKQNTKLTVTRAFVFAVLITVLQILFACRVGFGSGSLSERYFSLARWDTEWFQSIVDRGYITTYPPISQNKIQSNVAFLPAYPLLATLVKKTTGMPTDIALLVAAQIGAVGFWFYFFLFCKRWSIAPKLITAAVAAIFAYPSSFYLVSGYSESLFMAGMLGFFYWTTDDSKHAWWLAIIHGFIASLARIIGITFVMFPLVHALLIRQRSVLVQWRLWTSVSGALLGLGSFLLFCQWKFGHWDMYMQTLRIGWNMKTNYLWFADLHIYKFFLPKMTGILFDPNQISQLVVPMMLIATLSAILLEFFYYFHTQNNSWRQRAGFYLCILLLVFMPAAAFYTRNMTAMVRYTLPAFALFVLCILHFISHTGLKKYIAEFMEIMLPSLVFLGLIMQAGFIDLFTSGQWVA